MTKSPKSEQFPSLNIWAMTSGAPGMKSQALGLASALCSEENDQVTEKTIELNGWGKLFPGHLNPLPFHSLTKNSSPLQQTNTINSQTQSQTTWPDILITCGRRSTAISIAIGKASLGKTYRVHIQNPQIPTKYFDLVTPMAHDSVKGKNVIETKLALHKLSQQTLETEKRKWHDIWNKSLFADHNNLPVLGVILGGKNKKFGFDQERLNSLIQILKNARKEQNATIIVTPSSRTEAFVLTALNNVFKDDPKVWIWNQKNDNPYFGILSTANHLLVTADSVSMISECLFTTAPVHIFPLNGTSRRHKIFLDTLRSEKLTHPIDKTLNFSVNVTDQPIDETARIAHIIKQNYAQHIKG